MPHVNSIHFPENKFVLSFNTPQKHTGPRSAVGNVSGNRCVSDCRSRGREFDARLMPWRLILK